MRAWIALGACALFATPVWAQQEQAPVFADDPPPDQTPPDQTPPDQTPPDQNPNPNGYPNQGSYPTVQCAGGCPHGMRCSPDGVCEQAPSCAGGCPAGMTCSPDGVCETAAVPQTPMCTCPTGFVCTPAGTCVPNAATAQTLRPAREPDPNAASKARRRSTLGFVSSGIILGLGVAAGAIADGGDGMPETPLLLGAAAYLGIAGILTYGGSRAGRRAGGRGIGFLRVMGWITFVAGLGGLIISGAISAYDGSVPAGFIYGSAVFGALSPLLWAIDARIAAKQADELAVQREQARSWAPSLALIRDQHRVVGGALGASFEL